MILREVIEQMLALQAKYPYMGQVEVMDYENAEYTVASVEYDDDTDRIYIQFREV